MRSSMMISSRNPAPVRSSALSDGGDDALALYKALRLCAEEDTAFGRALGDGLSILGDAFRLYGADQIVTSFNGGKDAIVILHLMRAALAAHNNATGGSARLRIIFFEMKDEFPEVETFVSDTIDRYDLIRTSYADVGFADGLRQCIAEHGSKAFVLGTREGDPNAKGQQAFSPSSDWMPAFMRVNPILRWTYAEVWTFLREFGLPYCVLYDDGYTSLGKTTNTERNPALRRADGTYGAAWELTDDSLERAGRVASKPVEAPATDGRVRAESVALLVVGDEILAGKTSDGNTLVAARRLRAHGCTLRRVSVVSDQIGEIVEELHRLCAKYDVVLTSGGLGPTHDDVTLCAVAEALGVRMVRSAEMAGLIADRFSTSPDAKTLSPEVLDKMSTLPSGAVVRPVPDDADAWPILQCGNIFVLPGVPALFAAKLAVISQHFLQGKAPVLARRVLLTAEEEGITNQLNGVVAAHAAVSFGSYPVSEGAVRTIITLEADGGADDALDAALKALVAAVPDGSVERVDSVENLEVLGAA